MNNWLIYINYHTVLLGKTGKLTLVNRLFGAVQTKEVRDEKIQQLNERINEDEDNIGDVNNILK